MNDNQINWIALAASILMIVGGIFLSSYVPNNDFHEEKVDGAILLFIASMLLGWGCIVLVISFFFIIGDKIKNKMKLKEEKK
jgi:hypothetical protein